MVDAMQGAACRHTAVLAHPRIFSTRRLDGSVCSIKGGAGKSQIDQERNANMAVKSILNHRATALSFWAETFSPVWEGVKQFVPAEMLWAVDLKLQHPEKF